MNVGRQEAVTAVHVLAGVQIFMQTVYDGRHRLKRSLAKIYCNQKDMEEEKNQRLQCLAVPTDFDLKISNTVLSQISE